MRKVGFIGHRQVLDRSLFDSLSAEIENQIKQGCRSFTMGTHGDFDRLALAACRCLMRQYDDIHIEVIITSLNSIDANSFPDVQTVMYEIEETYFKQQITISNRKMIDDCDKIICYVDENSVGSGAKDALSYAKKKQIDIINLYKKENQPFYGISQEEKARRLKEFLK